MRTLEALRKQIETTEDMGSIVRTMKALAAVSIHQFERAAAAIADYEATVELGLQALLMHPDAPRGQPDAGPRAAAAARRALIVFGSDHGLCGRFNDEVVAAALHHLGAGSDGRVLVVGIRAAGRLEASGRTIDQILTLPGSVDGLSTVVHEILLIVDRWRAQGQVSDVAVCHNRRTEHVAASPCITRLLPLDVLRLGELAERPWPTRARPMFTMQPAALLSALVRQLLYVSLYRACAESLASEHASRLASMQAAERNIAERLDEMQAEFRSRRQESITEELLDVIAGFEVLSEPPVKRAPA
jgi:F-type H+-transporting ATPase subunit gamma